MNTITTFTINSALHGSQVGLWFNGALLLTANDNCEADLAKIEACRKGLISACPNSEISEFELHQVVDDEPDKPLLPSICKSLNEYQFDHIDAFGCLPNEFHYEDVQFSHEHIPFLVTNLMAVRLECALIYKHLTSCKQIGDEIFVFDQLKNSWNSIDTFEERTPDCHSVDITDAYISESSKLKYLTCKIALEFDVMQVSPESLVAEAIQCSNFTSPIDSLQRDVLLHLNSIISI